MQTVRAIDAKLIRSIDNAFNAIAKSLGLSYPTMMWVSISATIIIMAVGTLISWSNPLPLRMILVALYATLAFWMGRTSFRHLSYFHQIWSHDTLATLAFVAISNRTEQRVIRAGLAFVAAVLVSLSAVESVAAFQAGNMPMIGVVRNIASNMLGLPVLLLHYYAMCVIPYPDIKPKSKISS